MVFIIIFYFNFQSTHSVVNKKKHYIHKEHVPIPVPVHVKEHVVHYAPPAPHYGGEAYPSHGYKSGGYAESVNYGASYGGEEYAAPSYGHDEYGGHYEGGHNEIPYY